MGGVTFSVSPAVKFKPQGQIYIAKGVKPWYNNSSFLIYKWPDKDKVNSTDESVSGQATVTCKDVTIMNFMFGGCSGLTSLDLSKFDTSNVTSMGGMFNSCSKLTKLDLSNFNTSKVTNMSFMFSGCSGLTTLDISNFDTSNVSDMTGMFNNCSKLTSVDISNFDTSKVIDMSTMFYNCSNLTTIKGIIDMKSCTNYTDMFKNCTKLTGVKIKNPPSGFNGAGLSSSQYTIVS